MVGYWNMEFVSEIEIKGHFGDGLPYRGSLLKISLENFRFGISLSKFHKKSVPTFIKHFERRTKQSVQLAWSGINVLNELTAKENYLPESFVGCPQGLLISDGRLINPPLFNKPALLLDSGGNIRIENVSTKGGIRISCRSHKIEMGPDHRNLDGEISDLPDFCFYDLLYEKDYIYANERVIIQMGGNLIKEIIFSRPGQKVPLQPSGLTISIHDEAFPPTWDMREKELEINLLKLNYIAQAIAMGPMILNDSLPYLALDSEGWLSKHSMIITDEERKAQEFNCPGIAIGFDGSNNLVVLALKDKDGLPIKLPCFEIAAILVEHKILQAVSFAPDWQGSLLIGERLVVSSPYNNPEDPEMLFPVSSVVMGYSGTESK